MSSKPCSERYRGVVVAVPAVLRVLCEHCARSCVMCNEKNKGTAVDMACVHTQTHARNSRGAPTPLLLRFMSYPQPAAGLKTSTGQNKTKSHREVGDLNSRCHTCTTKRTYAPVTCFYRPPDVAVLLVQSEYQQKRQLQTSSLQNTPTHKLFVGPRTHATTTPETRLLLEQNDTNIANTSG